MVIITLKIKVSCEKSVLIGFTYSNYMGQHFIYNYEMVARSEGAGTLNKDLQHMLRRYGGYRSGSQVFTELTSTGKLVEELCQLSGSSTS